MLYWKFQYTVFSLITVLIFVHHIIQNQQKNRKYEIVTQKISNPPKICTIAEWNTKETVSIPYYDKMKKWADEKLTRHYTLFNSQSRLISAFVYHDHIAVIVGAQHTVGRVVHCRYFDCNREELQNTTYQGFIMPKAVAQCPRRIGAEYISLSADPLGPLSHDPIPLTFRVFKEPVHELSVCVGPLYGPESKWLVIAEFVEHYKLVGASYFYFTRFSLNEYDRRILDDYERLGVAEVISYNLEYETETGGWQYQMVQSTECHYRSMYHSKWMINVDIDERVVYTGPTSLLHYLRALPPNIGELSLSSTRVKVTSKLPRVYKNVEELKNEMMFLKYTDTSELRWYNVKGIYRPEKVWFMFFHWSIRQHPGIRVMSVPKEIIHFRHYRTTDQRALQGSWMELFKDFSGTRFNKEFEERLMNAVIDRVEYVYGRRRILCDDIWPWFLDLYGQRILDCRYSKEYFISNWVFKIISFSMLISILIIYGIRDIRNKDVN